MRSWDGETVVYNDLSGDTHHLDSFGTAVFEALLERSRTAADIRRMIEEDVAPEAIPTLEERIADVLDELRRQRLIEPA